MPARSHLDDSTSLNKIFVTNANVAQRSTSAVTVWTESDTLPHSGPYKVTGMQGTFVAITANGETAYSYDGISWKQLTGTLSGTYDKIVEGRNAGGYFVPTFYNCNESSNSNEKRCLTISKSYY